jgi:hypothetical protein
MAGMTAKDPRRRVNAVLLLHHTALPGPLNTIEGVRELCRHSQFDVRSVNTALGYPSGLDRLEFRSIVLHYTLFYTGLATLSERYLEFLSRHDDRYLAAFFQDEQSDPEKRLEFCREFGVKCVFTCIDRPHADRVYGSVGVETIITVLPGYVGDDLVEAGRRYGLADARRPIDIGYRGRVAPPGAAGAAREKQLIGDVFSQGVDAPDLRLDISNAESDRLHGAAWLRFLGRCRGVLGTESGSDFVVHGDTVPYRTISPRHFEAAALSTTQILYAGRYSGLMEPGVHYISLSKDLADLDEAIDAFRDTAIRRELAANARRDLIESGAVSYRVLARTFDEVMQDAGVTPPTAADSELVRRTLYPSWFTRRARRAIRASRSAGRVALNRLRGRPVSDAIRRRGN